VHHPLPRAPISPPLAAILKILHPPCVALMHSLMHSLMRSRNFILTDEDTRAARKSETCSTNWSGVASLAILGDQVAATNATCRPLKTPPSETPPIERVRARRSASAGPGVAANLPGIPATPSFAATTARHRRSTLFRGREQSRNLRNCDASFLRCHPPRAGRPRHDPPSQGDPPPPLGSLRSPFAPRCILPRPPLLFCHGRDPATPSSHSARRLSATLALATPISCIRALLFPASPAQVPGV